MKEKDSNELNEETRARGVKRNSENKIAEVTTSKKKRAKKPTAEAPEPDVAQNLFQLPFERTEGYEMRSRLGDAARDVAEKLCKVTLEEVTRAIMKPSGTGTFGLQIKVHFIILPSNQQPSNWTWKLSTDRPWL
jgi:hypothetical protein